jgi:hypothetical protein
MTNAWQSRPMLQFAHGSSQKKPIATYVRKAHLNAEPGKIPRKDCSEETIRDQSCKTVPHLSLPLSFSQLSCIDAYSDSAMTWGQCYDHDFRPFSANKLAFFLKMNVMIIFAA